MEKQMSMEEKIRRINELYHKSKQEGLTAEERKTGPAEAGLYQQCARQSAGAAE